MKSGRSEAARKADGKAMIRLRRGVALFALATAMFMAAACAHSSKSTGYLADDGGDVDDEPAGDVTISPPVQQSSPPANEADEGAPPVPPDATPPKVDAGGD